MARLSLSRAIYELFPFFEYVKLKRRFLVAGTGEQAPSEAASYESLSEEELASLLKEERMRATSMDEKTFKLTLAVTFALAVMGTVSTTLLTGVEHGALRFVLKILLVLVVFYALAAGYVALGAMRTIESYGLGAYPKLKDKPGARRAFLAASLARNEQISFARHARNETAYASLRNSFLCLFAAGILLLAAQSGVSEYVAKLCQRHSTSVPTGTLAPNDKAAH